MSPNFGHRQRCRSPFRVRRKSGFSRFTFSDTLNRVYFNIWPIQRPRYILATTIRIMREFLLFFLSPLLRSHISNVINRLTEGFIQSFVNARIAVYMVQRLTVLHRNASEKNCLLVWQPQGSLKDSVQSPVASFKFFRPLSDCTFVDCYQTLRTVRSNISQSRGTRVAQAGSLSGYAIFDSVQRKVELRRKLLRFGSRVSSSILLKATRWPSPAIPSSVYSRFRRLHTDKDRKSVV